MLPLTVRAIKKSQAKNRFDKIKKILYNTGFEEERRVLKTTKNESFMDPLYLKALMHGEISLKKNSKPEKKIEKSKFDEAIDKEIDAFVDAMELDEDPSHMGLQTAKSRKEAIKQEIKESIKLPELNKELEAAVAVLHSEGAHYLSKEIDQALQSDLAAAAASLNEIGIEEAANTNLQTQAKISDESMQAIIQVALAKFNEERFEDSLSLFTLLTILNPSYPEFWFRMGIVAAKCGDYEMASRAYAATLELDPKNIGARLFAAQCFVERKLINEAKEEVAEAKKLIENETVDQMWLDLLPTIESMIQTPH